MYVINARNVNDALEQGVKLLGRHGKVVPSRNGPTLELPAPCSTVYAKPLEKVLISHTRDANPFFHLMESLWILAGRFDVKFLSEFNSRIAEYSDDGVEFNAPYGYRMRVTVSEGASTQPTDQVQQVIDLLRKDPHSGQAVIQIWDSEDLTRATKDKARNTQCVFRVRDGKLHLTVYNRSNDMLWGAYGANVVQFSTLLEYVAAHVNIAVGTYTQVSDSFHVSLAGPGGELWSKLEFSAGAICAKKEIHDSLTPVQMRNRDMEAFEHDLKLLFNTYDEFGLKEVSELLCWRSDYFKRLVVPMLSVFRIHKTHGPEKAKQYLNYVEDGAWQLAANHWLSKRVE